MVGLSFLAIIPCSFSQETPIETPNYFVKILGVAQDAGYPQIDCKKKCCNLYWSGKTEARHPTCLGIVDQKKSQSWLVEATPMIKNQWQVLSDEYPIEGILITHAHAGHYTGLLELGREMLNTDKMPLYVLPRMAQFLTDNAPWSQLVQLENVEIKTTYPDAIFTLGDKIKCTPFLVPHRDEFSETAGFIIEGPKNKILFIPDIDKWTNWDQNISEVIRTVDYAILDGTFFQDAELPNRKMEEIPHPFVEETVALLHDLPKSERNKIYFIHFNHTNPLIYDDPNAVRIVRDAGMHIAREGMILDL